MKLNEVIQKLSRIKKFSEAADALRKRTERQWAKCESEDGYSRKIVEEEQKECQLSRWILHSFHWDKSPEGDDFWCNVHESICQKEDGVKKQKVKTTPTVLAMTKQRPTKVGYYWWQKRMKSRKVVVCVYRDRFKDGEKNQLFAKSFEVFDSTPSEFEDYDYDYIPVEEIPGYWSNKPIEVPTVYA